MRIMELTIRQTETFTINIAVPFDASDDEINEIAESVLGADDVLDAADEVGDCTTEVVSVVDTQPEWSEYVYMPPAEGQTWLHIYGEEDGE